MTAREYLDSKGLIVEEDHQVVMRFERRDRDADTLRIVTAPLGYVLNTFGSTIEAALAAGRSPYEALLDAQYSVATTVEGPDGKPTEIIVQRSALELGWAGHFGALKAQGVLD